jgi:hypothetical protein
MVVGLVQACSSGVSIAVALDLKGLEGLFTHSSILPGDIL